MNAALPLAQLRMLDTRAADFDTALGALTAFEAAQVAIGEVHRQLRHYLQIEIDRRLDEIGHKDRTEAARADAAAHLGADSIASTWRPCSR